VAVLQPFIEGLPLRATEVFAAILLRDLRIGVNRFNDDVLVSRGRRDLQTFSGVSPELVDSGFFTF
jgi:hypothetical protein